MDAEQQLIKAIGIPLTPKKIRIKKFSINYVNVGSGKPVVLLHAMNIGWGEWYANIVELAKYFKVYALDLPGSGNSTKINYESMDITKDYIEVVEEFIRQKKLTQVNLVGHSSGALLALMIAQRKKVSVGKVIAANAIGFSDEVPFQYKLLSIRPLARLLSKTAVKITKENVYTFLAQPMQRKYLLQEFANYYLSSITKDSISHPFLFLNHFLHRFKLKKEYLVATGGKIDNKTLLIMGDNDPNVKPLKADEVKVTIPLAKIVVFHNCGHVPLIEHSSRFNENVIQFIKQ